MVGVAGDDERLPTHARAFVTGAVPQRAADLIWSARHASKLYDDATAFIREGLKTRCGSETGVLSGRPITAIVTSFIAHIYQTTRGSLPIIGVGGIFDAQDAYDKIKAGANAVQIYTGWIYEGPGAVKRINTGLLRLLERDGFKRITDAIGVDVTK